jgi:hypothetical protein
MDNRVSPIEVMPRSRAYVVREEEVYAGST